MPQTIVIADDVTGANDIGIMYARAGLDAFVYSYKDGRRQEYKPCDALIIDTDSRFDSREGAYQKVYDAVKNAPADGVRQYINKQCSVFRGNIGAEFDAMLDALGEEFAVVVPGFPDNGRTTLHGIHYVNGVELKDSQFRNDPVHPMRCSDLKKILAGQTKRRVGAISYEVYAGGPEAVRAAVDGMRGSYGYVIMDVRDNADLALLARVLREERVLCGSSALSAYLAEIEQKESGRKLQMDKTRVPGRIFCMAGSLTPQTIAQTAYMKEKGYPVIELDTRRLFEEESRRDECGRVLRQADNAYETGAFVMIHSMNTAEGVAETKRIALEKGIDNTGVSSLVSAALSEISERVILRYGIRRIIVCGGDTSASLCAQLDIKGMKVLEEIEPGLPTCESLDEPPYRMVLKSGSFGSREFVEKAIDKLMLEETVKGERSAMTENAQLDRLTERYPVLGKCREDIYRAYEILKETYQDQGMLLVCGNGGSGADSEHIVGELMKEFAIRRPLPEEMQKKLREISPENGEILAGNLQGGLPAVPLTGNIALSTAYANDAVPELVFAQQVYGYRKKENSLLGISTSGNSKNVIYALETAKAAGMKTIGLTGRSGGEMKKLCDACICVPADDTPDIQELHLPVYHTLCLMIEEEFFG